MARPLISYYTPSIAQYKRAYYDSLPEKTKRHFLGQSYLELGKGSGSYLSRVFNCSRQTIAKGAKEVSATSFQADYQTQRRKGGGRKKKRSA